jgi:hypothetical protein
MPLTYPKRGGSSAKPSKFGRSEVLTTNRVASDVSARRSQIPCLHPDGASFANELTPDCGCSRLDPGQTRPKSLQDRFHGVDAGPIRQLARVITLVE